ncbi:MAG: sigma-70 family RNA polymerase sigma factor [Planctomycetota bacterium]
MRRGRLRGPPADALARILEGLPGYRAEAAFTTWAAAVGLRAGYTRLRRARVRRGETHPYELVLDEARDFPDEGVEDPHRRLEAEERVAALRRAVAGVLTERQRAAILGELRGIPTVELAARMGLTQNALYKLVHDARRKLASALRASGHGPETAGGRA